MLKSFYRNYQSKLADFSSKNIRKSFIEYFVKEKDHVYIPSSSVKTVSDVSVPFVNAGMNQFKNIFLGYDDIKVKRAANYQKCIRIGGKHNDLDTVGTDGCHHTFFEMLGNWSFNDYFKEEACRLSLEYLTQVCQLPMSSLHVTYFGGDEILNLPPDYECRDIWSKLGFPPDRIVPGDFSENFWEMGMYGPCGPSSEIFIDLGKNMNAFESKNFLEVWNLVFITFNRLENGQIGTLRKHFVDTGIGFERLVSILQKKESNYDTDIFHHLFTAIENAKHKSFKKYEGRFNCDIDTAYRILSDHSRMITIALADNILPDENPKLRKILRKSFYVAKTFVNEPDKLLIELCSRNLEYFNEFYPEMLQNFQQIRTLIEFEYDLYKNFHSSVFKRWLKESKKYPEIKEFDIYEYPGYLYSFLDLKRNADLTEIDPDLAFRLYDTYGLSETAIDNLAKSLKLSFNTCDFQEGLKKKQIKSKTQKYDSGLFLDIEPLIQHCIEFEIPRTDDSAKYDLNEKCYSQIYRVYDDNFKEIKDFRLEALKVYYILPKKTNLFSESCGQIADVGYLKFKSQTIGVIDNVQNYRGYIIHRLKTLQDYPGKWVLHENDEFEFAVNEKRRHQISSNHTASHLLNSAIRHYIKNKFHDNVLVCQKSISIDDRELSLTVAIYGPKIKIDVDLVGQLERIVLQQIQDEIPVLTVLKNRTDMARISDLVVVPNQSYYETNNRILSIGDFSKEPCGGTHVKNSKDIDDFVVVNCRNNGRTLITIRAVTGEEAAKARLNANQIRNKIENMDVSEIDLIQIDQYLLPFCERIQLSEVLKLRMNIAATSSMTNKRQIKK